jgi:ankyrin repeat protein
VLILSTELRDLLLCIDDNRYTFVHEASKPRKATAIRSVLYEVELDTEIIDRSISVKDKDGRTVLHRTADNGDKRVLLKLLKFIIENYRNPEGKVLCLAV